MGESRLRRLVGSWPGVEAGIKWEDVLVFTVAGKMFCATRLRGPWCGAISFKVEDGRFLELTERPGFVPAPYLARARWVQVEAGKALPEAELRQLLRRSYELVRARLPRKLQRELAD